MIIGFSKSNVKFPILSKLIMWWQGTSYSHTYVVLDGIIYHATGRGVHALGREEFEKKNVTVKEYKFDGVDISLVRLICILHMGKRYGYITLLGIFLRDLLGIKILGADDERTFICSELVGTIMELVFDVELGDQNYFTPKDIEEKIEWIKHKTL